MSDKKRSWLSLDRTIVSLGAVSLFNDIASEMIYPLLPAFLATTLGAGPQAVGVVEGIAEATASVGKGVFGWLSDVRTKRKPFVVTGYSLSVFARPLIAIAKSWGAVVAIRFADRIGKGVRTAPRDAMIAGLVEPERRGLAYGLERALDNAGALGGPLVSALLLRFFYSDVRSVFAWSLVPGLIALAILVFGTREAASTVEKTGGRLPDSSARLPRSVSMAAAIFFLFALANSTDAFLLLRARECGVALWELPLLWAAFNGSKALLNTPIGSLGDRIGRVPSILAGWGIYAVAYMGFGRVAGRGAIWLLFLFYSLFYAFTEGAERAFIADLAGPKARGRAFGIFHMATGLAALPASIAFGVIWKTFGSRRAFELDAVLALLSAAALATFALTRRSASSNRPASPDSRR